MTGVHRGDIWLADFGEPVGREQGLLRPAIVLSDDQLNGGPNGVVIVIPLTSRFRGLPSHIEVDPRDSGLTVLSYARCEDIRSMSDERLIAKMGQAPPEVMFRFREIMQWLLGLDDGRNP